MRKEQRTRQAIARNVQQLLGNSGATQADVELSPPVRFLLDAGRRPTVAVGAIACVVILISLWWVLSERPTTQALTANTSGAASGLSAAASSDNNGEAVSDPSSSSRPDRAHPPVSSVASTDAHPQTITVDVTGKVVHPGIYELPAGSRAQAAIVAAGGALPGVDLSAVNLARRLVDGEQVPVGVVGAASEAGMSATAGINGNGPSANGKVDLNTATAEQLDALPGVGPALAKRILDWRAQHRHFTAIADLRDVSGIGPAKYDELKDLVTV